MWVLIAIPALRVRGDQLVAVPAPSCPQSLGGLRRVETELAVAARLAPEDAEYSLHIDLDLVSQEAIWTFPAFPICLLSYAFLVG